VAARDRRDPRITISSISFLASDRWRVKRKQRIVAYDACGARLIHDAIRLNSDLLRESRTLRHSRHTNLNPRE
jgi:hypothetical protein